MTDVVRYAIAALSGGGIFAMITIGLALLFGVMGLMNFAYGELIMVGGFTMYALRDQPVVLMLAGLVIVVVLVSLLTEVIAFRPLRGAPPLTLLVASFAVSVALQNGARMTIGSQAKGVPPFPWLTEGSDFLGVTVSRLDIVAIVTSAVAVLGLVALMTRTDLGIRLRAAAEDFEMAELLGVRADRVIAAAFAITGVLAAVAAFFLIARQGAVNVSVGSVPVLIAFVGVVVGGMGSLPGAALGGFLLGALTSILDLALGPNLVPFRESFVFGAVILILVVRPGGLISAKAARV